MNSVISFQVLRILLVTIKQSSVMLSYWRRSYSFSVTFYICAVSYFISIWQEQHGMKDLVSEYKLFPHFKCSISPSNKIDCGDSKWVLPATHYRGVSTLHTMLFALVFPRLILDVCSVSTCLLHYLASDSNST